jgi:hypothetical protein
MSEHDMSTHTCRVTGFLRVDSAHHFVKSESTLDVETMAVNRLLKLPGVIPLTTD